jgi:alkanesulfonate monooxygenase SsuD/methylene tetrahydromethanopterin reductase-like flavin-dependent oxidoreductase (luciferase family)
LAWKYNARPEALGFEALLQQVLLAETAGFDFVWLADRMSERPVDAPSPLATSFEPTTLASALATRAKAIGFIATAATHQHEAYNLARRFASLDWISHGRGGWNMVAGSSEARDREYAAVIDGLWDSWEDDAFIYDKAASRIFEPAKMHVLNHQGEHLSVRGPLNVNRSPQGKPVVSAVFGSVLANIAEVIFLAGETRVADVAPVLEKAGRQRADVKVLRVLSDLADALQAIDTDMASGEIDGFVLAPATRAALETFVADVIPTLKARELLSDAAAGSTLRDRLGLPRREFRLNPEDRT